MPTIVSATTEDIRWPTSLDKSGSDAMQKSPNYSAAYVVLHTDAEVYGCGFTFTIGRGNDIVTLAIKNIAERIIGWSVDDVKADMGPEKGVIHLALGAVVNALWDLWAKVEGKPVWQLVGDFTPEEFVRCIDFRYITDAITPPEAIQLLREMEDGKKKRLETVIRSQAVPAYTTSPGWLGYSDGKMRDLLHETIAMGFRHFKLKVGGDLQQDRHRLQLSRDVIGYDNGNVLMVDANQVWDVNQAIEYMKALAEFKPWFIEEPTSPDDILGHATIRKALKPFGIGVATGEHCQNRVVFKQLLQAQAIDVCQIDACRLGGVNEALAVMLMAKKFNVPIVPHSGGVGLTEYTQHLATIDYLCVSGKLSILEHIDSLHNTVTHPTSLKDGYFVTPLEPGYSVEYTMDAVENYRFPNGQFWKSDAAKPILQGIKE